jgi:polyribonucleotide nucleotidyltransferase
MFSIKEEKIHWVDKELSIETGKIARQADGAVVVKYGNTTVLCTCVFQKTQSSEASFFPLTIHYQDKFYAAGKIPGGFVKREGKPSDREVLISRLIDRPIRPLFPKGFLNEVQVICTTLSYDPECAPEIAAMIGASAALSISGAPFLGPIAGCNVGYSKKNGFVMNPRSNVLEDNLLELTVAGTKKGVLMVESEVQELDESIMLDAVMFGFESFQPVIDMIESLVKKVGKVQQKVTNYRDLQGELFKKMERSINDDIKEALLTKTKLERRDKIQVIREQVKETFQEEASEFVIDFLFEEILSDTMRQSVIKDKKRVDGRKPNEIRQISCEVDVFPVLHGSAMFTRGETQALVVTTLGSCSDEQIVDDIIGDRKERFLLHYNFPAYSVGETGRIGAPGRREIGHGKLAWRAIHPMLPDSSVFPYAIRVVSEITESNGSSSMATVCGTSMSLMSAGVPMKSPVAGIAMGLIKEGKKYVVLSDIMGDEDHLGDMDFKVAGTKKGVTALQMDIKVTSINRDIIKDALEQAKEGRLFILKKMSEAIAKNRDEMSPSAPRIEIVLIDKDRIRDLIGPGGKVIKEICEKTKVKIDIGDDGTVSIFSNGKNELDIAIDMVRSIGCMPDIGAVFIGNVTRITDFGAFVTISGGKEGLVHVSNISEKRVNKVTDVLKIGQEVKVKILDIDDKNRIKLTMKGC